MICNCLERKKLQPQRKLTKTTYVDAIASEQTPPQKLLLLLQLLLLLLIRVPFMNCVPNRALRHQVQLLLVQRVVDGRSTAIRSRPERGDRGIPEIEAI